jgi:flagellar hook protein FlgE
MSLVGSLYVGASGLDAATTELSVVGDNIANSSTVGFKASRTVFADAMAQQLIGGATGQMGLGVKTETVQKLFSQGGFTTTGLATDVAIEGNGMFVVRGNHAGESGTFYTRNGQFTIDKDGYLTNLEGLRVQGLQADSTGTVTSGLLGHMQIGNASAPAEATDVITIRGNLDQTARPIGWDPLNPKTTSNFTTSMTVYDSLGKAIQLDIYFCKGQDDFSDLAMPDTSGGTPDPAFIGYSGGWTYHVMTDAANLGADIGGNLIDHTATTGPLEVAAGTLLFDTSGAMVYRHTDTQGFYPMNAFGPQALDFNFGHGTQADGSTTSDGGDGNGLDGLTQYAATSAVSFVTQAGSSSGSLSSISIGQDGTITGGFTNGQTRTLGQLIVANFKAPAQLTRAGSTLYIESPTSGAPTLGTPATADRGSLTAGTLEQSNVDISSEFVRMIAAQRSFQANAKTLTTADQLLAELMNLKR